MTEQLTLWLSIYGTDINHPTANMISEPVNSVWVDRNQCSEFWSSLLTGGPWVLSIYFLIWDPYGYNWADLRMSLKNPKVTILATLKNSGTVWNKNWGNVSQYKNILTINKILLRVVTKFNDMFGEEIYQG